MVQDDQTAYRFVMSEVNYHVYLQRSVTTEFVVDFRLAPRTQIRIHNIKTAIGLIEKIYTKRREI